MKKPTILFISLAIVFLVPFLYREGILLKKIELPQGIIQNKDFFLKQRISVLKNKYDIVDSKSDPKYFLRIENPYFTNVTFENYSTTSGYVFFVIDDYLLYGDIIKAITFFGPEIEELDKTDEYAKAIVKQCSQLYGNDYIIADWDTHRDNIELRSPKIVWQTESCAIVFIYTPYDVYLKLEDKIQYPPSGYTLRFAYGLHFLDKLKLSPYWTREKLGLD